MPALRAQVQLDGGGAAHSKVHLDSRKAQDPHAGHAGWRTQPGEWRAHAHAICAVTDGRARASTPMSTPSDTEAPDLEQMPRSTEKSIILTEAGTGRTIEQGKGSCVEQPYPRYPCIAWTPDGAEPPRLLTCAGFGKAKSLSAGTHAFVKMPHERFLRVSIMASDFGDSSGHPHLSLDQPVEFAGEVELNPEGHLVRWNNLSGTYRISKGRAFQVLGLAHTCLGPSIHHPSISP